LYSVQLPPLHVYLRSGGVSHEDETL